MPFFRRQKLNQDIILKDVDQSVSLYSHITELDKQDIQRARDLLEDNNLFDRITSLVGKITSVKGNWVTRFLPETVQTSLQETVVYALKASLDTALFSVDHSKQGITRWDWLNKQLKSEWLSSASVALSGAGGGATGLAGTLVELPVTTTLLMRAIAQIALEEGEDVTTEVSKIECLRVFALTSDNYKDVNNLDSTYYATRIAIAEALGAFAGKAAHDILPKTIAIVATRFGIPTGWKLAAQAIPVAGAVSGAMVNLAFINHFHNKARGHFIIRRLERKYGEQIVKEEYKALGAVDTKILTKG